ncbi:MAG: amidohydrolase family protein [Blastocatellia bacterium]
MRKALKPLLLLLALSTSPMAQMRVQPPPPPPPNFVNAADLMGWSDRVGELVAGKFADIVAVAGDPVQDTALLQHVQFVMKGATVIRNDFARH